jgi:hypothetical protein
MSEGKPTGLLRIAKSVKVTYVWGKTHGSTRDSQHRSRLHMSEGKPTGLLRRAKIGQGYICLRENPRVYSGEPKSVKVTYVWGKTDGSTQDSQHRSRLHMSEGKPTGLLRIAKVKVTYVWVKTHGSTQDSQHRSRLHMSEGKPTGLLRIAKIGQGCICLREVDFSFNQSHYLGR